MTIPFGTKASREVVKRLLAAGYETVFVGGAVRDFARGKEPSDIDIATAAAPWQVKKVFDKTVDIGIEHGTVLVLIEGEPIEVTAFRTESTYSDRRHPDSVSYDASLEEDLQRRDFTINALAMTLDGEVVDLFGGLDDLQNRIIRAVGNPAERFKEDPLRIFRALRFVSVLDFSIEAQTLAAMKHTAPELRHVAVERIKTEMDKWLAGKNPAAAFQYAEEIDLPAAYDSLFSAFLRLERYMPFMNDKHGWAALLAESPLSAAEIAKFFRMSKEQRIFLKQTEELLAVRSSRLFEALDVYDYPLDVLQCAEAVYRAQQGCGYDGSCILRMKEQLPIKNRSELAVSGGDLLRWTGRKGGAWTSGWLRKIETAVATKRIENDAQAIKEWCIDEITSEK